MQTQSTRQDSCVSCTRTVWRVTGWGRVKGLEMKEGHRARGTERDGEMERERGSMTIRMKLSMRYTHLQLTVKLNFEVPKQAHIVHMYVY